MDALVDLLREVSAGMQLRLQGLPALRELKLAPFSARLLAIVGRRSGCSQQELACWTGRDKAQIARTIKELEVRNLVVRSKSTSDWRSHNLVVTDDGECACRMIAMERDALASEVTLSLAPEERRAVIFALKKMKRGMSEILPPGGPSASAKPSHRCCPLPSIPIDDRR